MADRNIKYSDLWTIYQNQEQYQEQILHWFNLKKHLPILSWERQLEYLGNAPQDILLKHRKLLKPEAARKLGILKPEAKRPKPKKWNYGVLC